MKGIFSEQELELVQSAPKRADNFALGDQVFLNSGGPSMTIIGVDAEKCTVRINVSEEELEFPAICLTKCERGSPDENGYYEMVLVN